ncbi:MAG: FMN-binding protein [Mycobacteriales bacterium]
MRRAVFALCATVVGIVLLLGYRTAPGRQGARLAIIGSPAPGGGGTPQPTHAPSAPGTSSTGPPATPPSSSTRPPATPPQPTVATSRTVVGAPIATPYGTVQVRSTLTGNHLTAITVLQAPSDNPRSQQLTSYATPILRHEALAAGSAQIDIVSGASYTSDGYAQSLQSTLDSRGG